MSSRSPPELLTLPQELIESIIAQVTDKIDLFVLRKTCKTLDGPAAKELFKSVFVSPSEKDIGIWNNISEQDATRCIPRHALIKTQPDVEDSGCWTQDRERVEIGEDFEKAVAALSRFPSLESVEISFTPECKGLVKRRWEEDAAESPLQREDMLRLIFEAIGTRAMNKDNKPIKKLTITNLQNVPVPNFTTSGLFRNVMGRLEELHLCLTQESNNHRPDHDYTKVELRTFPEHLCTHWLKPFSANLRALSIYHRSDNWGPFPGYFDFSKIDLPKLENLALGYYTFAHDNDLDWILAIKSLRKLVLHNAMIASYIRIDTTNMPIWNVPQHDWIPMSNQEDNWAEEFKYQGKWSSFLDRIADSLPNLIGFRFDSGGSQGDPPYGLEYRDVCGARVFPRRYIVFDNGILPTHWTEARDGGELHSWREDEGYAEVADQIFPNLHKLCLKEDQKSLDRVLELTKSRR